MRDVERIGLATMVFLLLAGGAFLPAAEAVSFGAMGTRVLPGDTDFVPTLKPLPAGISAFLARREAGVAGDTRDDGHYVHFAAAAPTQLAANVAYRLTCGVASSGSCPTDVSKGTWSESGDQDVTSTPGYAGGSVVDFISRVRYMAIDDKPGWSVGDFLYVDVDNDGMLSAGDLRLVIGFGSFSCTNCQVGTVVAVGDGDLAEAGDGDRDRPLSLTYSPGVFKLFWWDGNGDGIVDRQDVLYLKGPSAPTYAGTQSVHPDIGDARMGEQQASAFTSLQADLGTVVQDLATDNKRTYRVATPTLVVTNTADPDPFDQHLLLHFPDPDGTNDHLREGDIFLHRGPGGGGGQVVTSKGSGATQPGQGTGIDASFTFTDRLRYQDLPPAGFTPNDPLFIKHPANSDLTKLQINDIRITQSLNHAANTIVKSGDLDINSVLIADANFVLKRHDQDGANQIQLRSLSSVQLADALGTQTSRWEPATEGLYMGSGTTVATGMTRLFHPSLSSGPTVLVDCDAPGLDGDCPGGPQDPGTLVSYQNIRVTGTDSVYDVGQSEYIYDSTDSVLNAGDLRVIDVGALTKGTTVADADADAAASALISGDTLLLDRDPACATTCLAFARAGAVQMLGSFGTRYTSTSSGFVPILTESTGAFNLVRYNRGDSTSASDDSFYATLQGGLPLALFDLRITPINPTAGSLIKTADTTYAEEVSGGSSFTRDGSAIPARLCYIDVDGLSGLSKKDPVYIEAIAATFGPPFGSPGTIHPFDLRLSPYPADSSISASQTYTSGTIIRAGDADLISGQTTCATPPAGQSWFFRFFDNDANGAFGSSGTSLTEDDVAYVTLGTTLNNAPPPLFALRVSGSGTSSSGFVGGGGGGGGGGTTPPTPPASPPPATPPAGGGNGGAAATSSDVAKANRAIDASLEVRRTEDGNVLRWLPQTGAAGYQIWRANSDYVLIDQTRDGTVGTYTDGKGSDTSHYLVTSYFRAAGGGFIGFVPDLDEGVPGGSDLLGTTASRSTNGDGDDGGDGEDGGEPKEDTPGIGLFAVLATLGAALVAARRRA